MKDQNRTGGPKNRWLIHKYDTLEGWIYKLPERPADAMMKVIQPVRISVCRVWGGHLPINDQCNLPAHRFCVFCQEPTPYAAVAPGN